MANNDALNGLKKSLDSFSDVALAEFALTELDNEKDPNKSDKEQQEFADSMRKKVIAFLEDNRDERRPVWDRVEVTHAKDFKAPAGTKSSLCPPGFHEEGGICVRNSQQIQ
jgi:hypothetical protein